MVSPSNHEGAVATLFLLGFSLQSAPENGNLSTEHRSLGLFCLSEAASLQQMVAVHDLEKSPVSIRRGGWIEDEDGERLPQLLQGVDVDNIGDEVANRAPLSDLGGLQFSERHSTLHEDFVGLLLRDQPTLFNENAKAGLFERAKSRRFGYATLWWNDQKATTHHHYVGEAFANVPYLYPKDAARGVSPRRQGAVVGKHIDQNYWPLDAIQRAFGSFPSSVRVESGDNQPAKTENAKQRLYEGPVGCGPLDFKVVGLSLLSAAFALLGGHGLFTWVKDQNRNGPLLFYGGLIACFRMLTLLLIQRC